MHTMTSLRCSAALLLGPALAIIAVQGVLTGSNLPMLACHVPLEVKIFADSSYQATSADLKSCTHIVLSSVYTLFLTNASTVPPPTVLAEKRSLELLRQQTPEAVFSFSLRSNSSSPGSRNLKTIFNGPTATALLVEFLRINKLKSFDIAWDIIQSTPDYLPLLKFLKSALAKEGFKLTTTIGAEVNRTNTSHVLNITSVVDRIFLVPSTNRHYGQQYTITKEPELAFDTLELNEGAFLKLYASLNLNREKVVVGLSLETLVWKMSANVSSDNTFVGKKAVLQLLSYYESCKLFNNTWKLIQPQPSLFYHLAVAPTKDQWMIHIDPVALGRRVDLLKQYGFAGVALYDYYKDDFAGICSPSGKVYPLIQQARVSVQSNKSSPYPEINSSGEFCVPFLGLTLGCQGAFNFGTSRPITNSNQSSTLTSLTMAPTPTLASTTIATMTSTTALPLKIVNEPIKSTIPAATFLQMSENKSVSNPSAIQVEILPVLQTASVAPSTTTGTLIDGWNNLARDSVSIYSTKTVPEDVVTSEMSVDVTVFNPITVEAQISDTEHVIRTRRSSISDEEFGTQSSYSSVNFLDPNSTEAVLNFSTPVTSLPTEDMLQGDVKNSTLSADEIAVNLSSDLAGNPVEPTASTYPTTQPNTYTFSTMYPIRRKTTTTTSAPPIVSEIPSFESFSTFDVTDENPTPNPALFLDQSKSTADYSFPSTEASLVSLNPEVTEPSPTYLGSMIDTSDSHDHAAGTVFSFPTIETSGATGNFYDSSTFSTAVTESNTSVEPFSESAVYVSTSLPVEQDVSFTEQSNPTMYAGSTVTGSLPEPITGMIGETTQPSVLEEGPILASQQYTSLATEIVDSSTSSSSVRYSDSEPIPTVSPSNFSNALEDSTSPYPELSSESDAAFANESEASYSKVSTSLDDLNSIPVYAEPIEKGYSPTVSSLSEDSMYSQSTESVISSQSTSSSGNHSLDFESAPYGAEMSTESNLTMEDSYSTFILLTDNLLISTTTENAVTFEEEFENAIQTSSSVQSLVTTAYHELQFPTSDELSHHKSMELSLESIIATQPTTHSSEDQFSTPKLELLSLTDVVSSRNSESLEFTVQSTTETFSETMYESTTEQNHEWMEVEIISPSTPSADDEIGNLNASVTLDPIFMASESNSSIALQYRTDSPQAAELPLMTTPPLYEEKNEFKDEFREFNLLSSLDKLHTSHAALSSVTSDSATTAMYEIFDHSAEGSAEGSAVGQSINLSFEEGSTQFVDEQTITSSITKEEYNTRIPDVTSTVFFVSNDEYSTTESLFSTSTEKVSDVSGISVTEYLLDMSTSSIPSSETFISVDLTYLLDTNSSSNDEVSSINSSRSDDPPNPLVNSPELVTFRPEVVFFTETESNVFNWTVVSEDLEESAPTRETTSWTSTSTEDASLASLIPDVSMTLSSLITGVINHTSTFPNSSTTPAFPTSTATPPTSRKTTSKHPSVFHTLDFSSLEATASSKSERNPLTSSTVANHSFFHLFNSGDFRPSIIHLNPSKSSVTPPSASRNTPTPSKIGGMHPSSLFVPELSTLLSESQHENSSQTSYSHRSSTSYPTFKIDGSTVNADVFETRPFWLSLPRTNFTTASVTPVYRTQSKDTERPTHLFPFLQGEASPVTAPPAKSAQELMPTRPHWLLKYNSTALSDIFSRSIDGSRNSPAFSVSNTSTKSRMSLGTSSAVEYTSMAPVVAPSLEEPEVVVNKWPWDHERHYTELRILKNETMMNIARLSIGDAKDEPFFNFTTPTYEEKGVNESFICRAVGNSPLLRLLCCANRSLDENLPVQRSNTVATPMHENLKDLSNVTASPVGRTNEAGLAYGARANVQSIMVNLTELLKDVNADDIVSAVSSLNHTVPDGFLEELLENNLNSEHFTTTSNSEDIYPDTSTDTSKSTTIKSGNFDIYDKNFWNVDKRNPVKALQRKAAPRLNSVPSVGRLWQALSTKSPRRRYF